MMWDWKAHSGIAGAGCWRAPCGAASSGPMWMLPGAAEKPLPFLGLAYALSTGNSAAVVVDMPGRKWLLLSLTW